jgi:deoxyadenosine/deoxycytidine kinase
MLRKDGILSDAEVKVYSELFVNMTVDVMYPSMIVFLNCPPDVSLARIKKRGRGCETGISGDYVGKLNAEVKTLCDEFSRYTFVKEIDASVDLTEEEIESRARIIYDRLKMLREEPIVTRMGV